MALLAFDVPALKVFERGPPPWVGEGIARLEVRARESFEDIARSRASLGWAAPQGGSGDSQGDAGARSSGVAREQASGGGDADVEDEEAFGALLQHAGVGAESGCCDMESGDVSLLTYTYTDSISRRFSGIGASCGARSGPGGCRDVCLRGDAALLARTAEADRTLLGFGSSGDPEGVEMVSGVGGGFSNLEKNRCFVNAPLQLFLRLKPVANVLEQVLRRCKTDDDSDLRYRVGVSLARHLSDIRAGTCSSAEFLLGEVYSGRLGKKLVQKAGAVGGEPPAGDAVAVLLGDSHAKGECVGLVDFLPDFVAVEASGKRAKGKRAAAGACSGSPFGGGGLCRRALFGGVVRERQYCRRCEKATDVLRACHRIDLKCSGSSNSSVTLQDLLDTWGGSLPAGNCERGCEGSVTQAVRYLEKEPPVLVFVINRTDGQKGKHKCTRAVRFPENLDVPVVRSGRYSLAGVLQHQGPLRDQGHFVATCALGSGGYVVCDDEEVSRKFWPQVATLDMWRSVQLLVYARQTAARGVCEGVAVTPYLRDPCSTKVARDLAQGAVRACKRLPSGRGLGARNVSLRGASQVASDLKRSNHDSSGVGSSASASVCAARSSSRTRQHLVGETSNEALSLERFDAVAKFPGVWGSEQERQDAREAGARAAERRVAKCRQRGVRDLRGARRASTALALRAQEAMRRQLEAARRGSADRILRLEGLRDRFGEELVQSYVAEVGGDDSSLDLDVLEAVLETDQACELDVQVERAFFSSQRGCQLRSSRWQVLMEFLPSDLREGLLLALQSVYGASCQSVLAMEWSCLWIGWDSRKLDGSSGDPHDGDGLRQLLGAFDLADESIRHSDAVSEAIYDVLLRHVRLAHQQRAVDHPSDEQRKADLSRQGLTVGQGQIWATNNCLSDSLLQLLREAGFVDLSVDAHQRREACWALREELKSLPEGSSERPRKRDPMRSFDMGYDPDAFLQPDVHGGYALCFFERYFREKGLLCRGLPSVGVRISVHSRFDSDAVTPAFTEVCRSPGLPETDKPLEFWLYNTTGDGIAGTHFDPILKTPSAVTTAFSGSLSSGGSEKSVSRRLRRKIDHGSGSSSLLSQASRADCVEVSSEEEQPGVSEPDKSCTASAAVACEGVTGVAEVVSRRRSTRLAERAEKMRGVMWL